MATLAEQIDGYLHAHEDKCAECDGLFLKMNLHPCPVCERKLCRKCHGKKWVPIGGHSIYTICHQCEAVSGEFRDKLRKFKQQIERTMNLWRAASHPTSKESK